MAEFSVRPIGDIFPPGWAQYLNRYIKERLDNTADEIGREIVKDFEATTETWEHKPHFIYEVRQRAGDTVVTVGPEDNPDAYPFLWVDEGVQPHRIPASGYKRMSWQTQFTPKSIPRKIGSKQGGKSGDWAHAMVIPMHPGIAEPRHFSETIADVWQQKVADLYGKRFEVAIQRAFKGGRA